MYSTTANPLVAAISSSPLINEKAAGQPHAATSGRVCCIHLINGLTGHVARNPIRSPRYLKAGEESDSCGAGQG